MYKMDKKHFIVTLDPTNEWPDLTSQQIIESCGFIPTWLVSYATAKRAETLKEHMDLEYTFGLFEMTGSNIDEKLVHTYPEDPPLYPILHWTDKATQAEFLMYPHAICAMRQAPEDEWFTTRMDQVIRLKEVLRSDQDCTPHIRIWLEGQGSTPHKLQQCVCYDSTSTHTYWEWQDIELFGPEVDDYEDQER